MALRRSPHPPQVAAVRQAILDARLDRRLPERWKFLVDEHFPGRVTVTVLSPAPYYAADPRPTAAVWNQETGDWVTGHGDRVSFIAAAVYAVVADIVEAVAPGGTVDLAAVHGVPAYHPGVGRLRPRPSLPAANMPGARVYRHLVSLPGGVS